ncbi:hypothetical protein SAMN04488542_11798 [Fontibacillus panacisegetis]|uniref:Uncharacterized protein n=1 Tax=Fontibacillus panacisegetis TaxID=670482 RepID=A0A1G7P335_9BACL|nr:hypothetical protein [Fontibacillus panacisegetis]SDF80716.1 hypothetical protein SAMN04488542_11798 [Fontibacillus panacisegetis]
MKNRLVLLVIAALLVVVCIYWGGYRINGLSAARANSFVPKDSILLDQVDYNWGSVYIFNSNEKPITAISNKKLGFLWVSRASTFFFHNNDPVKTIGGTTIADEEEQATVFSVIVNDPEVTLLEVGPEGERQRKNVVLGEPITFSWNKTINWFDLTPNALNQEGKLLYEYRFAEPNFTKLDELKWYPI